MKTQQTGFTLVELLVTLAIVVVLATWAIPSFRTTVRNNNVITCGNELITAVVLARSEAVNRASVAGVVPISGDFANGWRVLIDTTASTPTVLNNDDEVARTWPACPNMNLTVETTHPGEIRFNGSTISKIPSGSGSSFKSMSTVLERQPSRSAVAPPTR